MGVKLIFLFQADGKRKATLAERDQVTALDQATSIQNTSHDRLLWHTPVPRRGSAPQVPHLTEPPVGGRMSPKHSSSISSITITSKKVSRSSSLPETSIDGQDRDRDPSRKSHVTDPNYMYTVSQTEGIPQRKALVVKITEQKIKTSRFLQPDAKNGCRTTGENYFLPSSSATGTDYHLPELSKMSYIESQSQVPSCLATQETQTPVVLRRKATIIKVQEKRDIIIKKDEGYRRKVDYRHSFCDLESQSDNGNVFSGAETQVLSTKTKLYRSTMSLQLTSFNGALMSNGLRPQRPASCYASLFNPIEPSVDSSQDASVHNNISVLPHETNIDPACSTTSSSSRCCSTEGGVGSHDKIYTRTESSALDKGQSIRESALLRNQPLTLIKVPGRKPHSVI